MNIGYHSDFMDRIIERADKRQERMEKMINKMLDKSEPILNAGKPKPQTNEEYMCSCSSDELVSILCKLVDSGILQEWRIKYHCADSDEDAVRMWLKEKHNEM